MGGNAIQNILPPPPHVDVRVYNICQHTGSVRGLIKPIYKFKINVFCFSEIILHLFIFHIFARRTLILWRSGGTMLLYYLTMPWNVRQNKSREGRNSFSNTRSAPPLGSKHLLCAWSADQMLWKWYLTSANSDFAQRWHHICKKPAYMNQQIVFRNTLPPPPKKKTRTSGGGHMRNTGPKLFSRGGGLLIK